MHATEKMCFTNKEENQSRTFERKLIKKDIWIESG